MSKKNYKCGVITSAQLFDMQKPQYNGYICGHGPHKSKKIYNRKNKSWKYDLG